MRIRSFKLGRRASPWIVRVLISLAILAIGERQLPQAHAQSIFSNPINGTDPGLVNPYTAGQVVDPNLTVSGIGRGSGINGNAGGDRYNSNSWNTVALDTDAYFTWTLTPSSGYQVSFVDLQFIAQKSGSGPTNASIRSSLDSFASDIDSWTMSASSQTFPSRTITLSGASFQDILTPIEFRLYGWGASGASGTYSINSFVFNGSVSPTGGGGTPYTWTGGVIGTPEWEVGQLGHFTDPPATPWANGSGNSVTFTGTGETVTLVGAIQSGTLSFESTGFVLTGGTSLEVGLVSGISVGETFTATIGSVITGATGLNKSGLGTLVLTNSGNNYTGNVTISAGTLEVSTEGNFGAAANPIVLGGTLKLTTQDFSNDRTYTGSGTIDVEPGRLFTSTGVFNTTGLTLSNTGTVSLEGSTRTVGTLAFTAAGTLSGTGTITAGELNAAGLTSGTATVTADLDLGTGNKLATVGTGGTLALTGNVTLGGASLQKRGEGTLVLQGANAGLFRVQIGNIGSLAFTAAGGVVQITNNTALGTNQTHFNFGTLEAMTDLTGVNAIATGLSIGGREVVDPDGPVVSAIPVLAGSNLEFIGDISFFRATNSHGQLQFNVNNTTTLSGAWLATSGSGTATGVNLGGTGTLVISGDATALVADDTFTLTDSATLKVNGVGVFGAASSGAGVNVSVNTTLGGSGTVNGPVTVAAGGNLIPGDGPDNVFTLTTGAVLEADANFAIRITGGIPAVISTGGSSEGSPGDPANNTFLNAVLGSLTFAEDFNIILDGTGAGLTIGQDYSYAIAQASSAVTIPSDVDFTTIGFAADNITLTQIDGTVYVNFTAAVPEPGSMLALAAAGLGVAGFLRRRRIASPAGAV